MLRKRALIGKDTFDIGSRYMAVGQTVRGENNATRVYDFLNEEWIEFEEAPTTNVSSRGRVLFIKNGTELVVASWVGLYVYDTSDWSRKPVPITNSNGRAYSFAISPDGTLGVVGMSGSPYLRLYQMSDWAKLADLDAMPSKSVGDVAFSPDGKWLACAMSYDPYLLIYNTMDWSPEIIDTSSQEGGKLAYFTKDSKLFFAKGRVYDTSDWSNQSNSATVLVATSTERYVAGIHQSIARFGLQDKRTLKLISTGISYAGLEIRSCEFTRNGAYMSIDAGGGAIDFYDTKLFKKRFTLQSPLSTPVTAIDFSPF